MNLLANRLAVRRAEKVLLRHRCAACCPPAAGFLCGVWGMRERGVRAGADWIDHSIQMIAHGGFKRVFFRSFADRS